MKSGVIGFPVMLCLCAVVAVASVGGVWAADEKPKAEPATKKELLDDLSKAKDKLELTLKDQELSRLTRKKDELADKLTKLKQARTKKLDRMDEGLKKLESKIEELKSERKKHAEALDAKEKELAEKLDEVEGKLKAKEGPGKEAPKGGK